MIRRILVLSLLLFLLIPTLVFAEDIVFPLPKGPVYITVGYGDYITHQGSRSKYALLLEISLNPMLKGVDREPKSNAWHTVDNSYLWFKPEFSPLLTEPIDCRIGNEENSLIARYQDINKKNVSRKIWSIKEIDDMKFFAQNALDFGIFQANKILTGLDPGNYSCSGFWEQYLGLFTADQILKSILGDSF